MIGPNDVLSLSPKQYLKCLSPKYHISIFRHCSILSIKPNTELSLYINTFDFVYIYIYIYKERERERGSIVLLSRIL